MPTPRSVETTGTVIADHDRRIRELEAAVSRLCKPSTTFYSAPAPPQISPEQGTDSEATETNPTEP